MTVSLITACYNSIGTIEDAMASVRSQRLSGVSLDYIVIDGGSSDGTARAVEKFCSAPAPEGMCMRWVSAPDKGMYDALNKGIAMARGDVVGILNADDVLEDATTVERVAAAFADGVDAVYGDVRFVKDDLETTLRYYGASRWRPWMHNWGYMPPHPAVYIRRAAFERYGAYKLGYRISADFELMVRFFCRNRIPSAYLPGSVVKMRMGGASTKGLASTIVLNAENVRANRENGYFSCMAMMLPKYLFKIWGFVFTRGPSPRKRGASAAGAKERKEA